MSKEFKLFLASSGELKKERKAIKELIKRYNHVCVKFEVQMWENMSKSFTPKGIQKDTINKVLKNSDVVILIFHSFVGKFTKKELDIAMNGIKNKTGKPKYLLFYYSDKNSPNYHLDFNDVAVLEKNTALMKLVKKYQKKDVPIKFKSISDLKTSINEELRKIEQLEYDAIESCSTMQTKEQSTPDNSFDITIHSNIPPQDKNFIDREDDIVEIIKAIINSNECLVYSINGMGGIGKSAIINEVCHIFKATWDGNISKKYLEDILGKKPYFSDGILWIRFEEDLSLERHIEILSELIEYKIEYDKDTNKLRYTLEKLFENKDILIVLDSCEQNIGNFKFFYDTFIDNIPMLITSRINFKFISYQKDLDILEKKPSRELFKQTISLGHDKMDNTIDMICKDIGYLPLAIIIVAKMTDKYGLNQTLQRLKDKLNQEEKILQNGKEKMINMNRVFNLSFDLLDKQEKKVLAISSIFNYPFTIESLKEIMQSDVVETLYELENKSLINKNINEKGENIYSFHPLIREFSQDKFTDILSEIDRDKYKKAKIQYFLNITKFQQDKLEEHIKEIFDILKSCEDDENFISFVKNLDWWLSNSGYWIDREDLLKEAIKRSNKEEDKNNFRVSLGDLYSRQNKLIEAKQEFDNALDYYTIDNNSGYYLFIYYKLNSTDYREMKYKNSYISNHKFLRKSLYLNEIYYYGAFCKTNGWITKNHIQKDLTIKYGLARFVLDINDIKNSNAMYSYQDIINYLITIEEYNKAKKLINSLEKNYNKYPDFNTFLLYLIDINIENKEFNNDNIFENCQKDAKSRRKKSALEHINFLKGKTYLYQDNPSEAKEWFEKLEEEHDKNFWLGRCEIKLNNLPQAQNYLEQAKEFYIQHENIFEIARIDIYLGFIISKIDIQKANKILSHAKAVFDKYDFIPKEYYQIIEQIKGINIDTSNIEIQNTSFFLENLPSTIQLKDNKEMVLIPKGVSFYGEGEQKRLTIDEILKDINSWFESNRYEEYKDNIFLYDFYIDKECVTNQEYINYCKDAKIEIPKHLQNIDEILLNNPITNISVDKAKDYAKHNKKELPLPQEWEKAFRGEKGSLYFKCSSTKDLITAYDTFELTDKKESWYKDKRYKSTNSKYKLTDSFEKDDISNFIFRCVKPVFSYEDIKGNLNE